MSLLLKALKQTDARSASQSAPDAPATSPPATNSELAHKANFQDSVLWDGASANSLIACEAADRSDPIVDGAFAAHTALIEPFEPYAEMANEFLAADVWQVADDADAPTLDEDSDARISRQPAIEAVDLDGPVETPPLSEVAADTEPSLAPESPEDGAGPDPDPTPPSEGSAVFASVLGRLDELQSLVARNRDGRDEPQTSERNAHRQVDRHRDAQIRDEFRELRDHLLTRIAPTATSTVLCIDAGRQSIDPRWLIPLAASFCQGFRQTFSDRSRVLLVDVGQCDGGLARSLGLEDREGFARLLKRDAPFESAILNTEHSEIDLLSCDATELCGVSLKSMEAVWSELKGRYRLILVAAGSIFTHSPQAWASAQPFEHFLPLADGVVLSVELNGTPRAVADATCRRLANLGAELLGCVVHGEAE